MDMLPEGLTATDPETFNCYIPDRARRNGIDALGGYFRSTRKRANTHLDDPVKGRYPVPCLDAAGVPVLAVPLDQYGQRFALADPEVWVWMQEEGADGLWYASDNGKGRDRLKFYVPMAGQHRPTSQVARYIAAAQSGEVVRFLNGNPLDVRRANLSVIGVTRAPTSKPRQDTHAMTRRGAAKRAKAVSEGRTFSREGTKA